MNATQLTALLSAPRLLTVEAVKDHAERVAMMPWHDMVKVARFVSGGRLPFDVCRVYAGRNGKREFSLWIAQVMVAQTLGAN